MHLQLPAELHSEQVLKYENFIKNGVKFFPKLFVYYSVSDKIGTDQNLKKRKTNSKIRSLRKI